MPLTSDVTMFNTVSYVYNALITISIEKKASLFSENSEAGASEFPENIEVMFSAGLRTH